MSNIRIYAKQNDFEKVKKYLTGVSSAIPSVLSNSVNKAIEQGRTAAIRAVTREYTVQSKTVRETMQIKRSKKDDLSAELLSKGKRLPLSKFKHSPSNGDTTGSNRREIRVSEKKGSVNSITNGFIWKGRIFRRLGEGRLPINQQFSHAVPTMLNDKECVEEIQDVMENAMAKRIDYEVRRALTKAVKK